MINNELKTINKHLKNTDSGWFNILARYTDNTILIVHGTANRQYKKLLKIKEVENE